VEADGVQQQNGAYQGVGRLYTTRGEALGRLRAKKSVKTSVRDERRKGPFGGAWWKVALEAL